MTQKKRGPGRPATGVIVRKSGKPYGVRVTLADGTTRQTIPFNEPMSEERARALKPIVAKRARELGVVAAGTGETVTEWSERWLAYRLEKGLESVKHDRGRLTRHVLPVIGGFEMAAVGREQIELVVEHLDRRIRSADKKEHLEWKTASNVWVLVSKMFKDAVRSKRRDLRCRTTNPADGVEGPERGVRKAKQYLFPSEFLQLVNCQDIELQFRQLYAVAVYLFARAGELAALTWADVDMDHRVVHISKAVDRATGRVKSTKSGDTRRIPIEPNLVPLLEHLKETTKGERCFWMPDDEDRAIIDPEAPVGRGREAGGAPHERGPPEAHHLPRPPRDWHHLDGRPGRRPPPDQTACRPSLVLDDRRLHPRGGEPHGRLRKALPGAARGAHRGFGFNFGFSASPDSRIQRKLRHFEWSKGGSNP